MDIVVLADTHLRGPAERRLPSEALRAMSGADLVLHAGDVSTAAALASLEHIAPLRCVLGNNDHELVGLLPEVLELELDGVRTAVVHDSGPRTGRAATLHRRFPRAQLVVFGHSHVPVDELGVDGQLLFNPGSPTQRRTQPHPTMGLLKIESGRILERRIVAFDDR